MLVAPRVSFPGVYIQEVESDVRTIVGVDTATTAFIGRARRGPVNTPIVINSYADFELRFGQRWLKSALGYAVEDFFANGGFKAVIVRVENAESGATHAKLTATTLELEAKYPGSWGNDLKVRVTYIATEQDIADSTTRGRVAVEVAKRYEGVTPQDIFNLTVLDSKTGQIEVFEHATTNVGPRQIREVLAEGSELVRVVNVGERPDTHADLVPSSEFRSVWDDPNAHAAVTENAEDGEHPRTQDIEGSHMAKQGIYALEDVDIFNLLCIPPYLGDDVDALEDVPTSVWSRAAAYCEDRRSMLIVDPPKEWTKEEARDGVPLPDIGANKNAALYFPRIKKRNSLRDNQIETFAPCGVIAGVMARTDVTRGVWKAPAGLDTVLRGVTELGLPLTDAENGELNPLGINCLRNHPPAGNVVWGARTLVGDDRLASQWKYLPVRRTALYIEESLYRAVKWAVFEPNDEPLWSQLRLNIGVFMNGLFRQGAFQGQTPREAYLVQCDKTTTTQADIDKGIVNIVVGFAPLKPAEFVVIYIKQLVGQLAV